MLVQGHLVAPLEVVRVDVDLPNDALSIGDVTKIGVVGRDHMLIVVKLVDYLFWPQDDQIGECTCTQGAN